MNASRLFLRCRALAVAVLVAALAVSTASTEAQTTPEVISGEVPSRGVALLVAGVTASPAELIAALRERGCEAETIHVTQGGEWRSYVAGAPDFANAPFDAATSGGMVEAGRAFAVLCSGEAPSAGAFLLETASGVGSGGFATQNDVRVAEHPGYDRVVFEFRENVIPAYEIEYVSGQQSTCGAGTPVSVAGSATLRVRFTNAHINDDAGNLTVPSRSLTPGLTSVEEAREICAFEGQVTWLIGVDVERPFRLALLQDTGRVVLDFAHVDCADCVFPEGLSGVVGAVFAGPQCPVVQDGVNCPDRLADISFDVMSGTEVVASARSGADGLFRTDLDPGNYQITFPTAGFPTGSPQNVTVFADTYGWVEVHVDTGIR